MDSAVKVHKEDMRARTGAQNMKIQWLRNGKYNCCLESILSVGARNPGFVILCMTLCYFPVRHYKLKKIEGY